MKWLLPTLWIMGFGFATCSLWLDAFHGRNNAPPPGWMKWQFLAFWLAGSVFLVWWCARIKRVQLDDKALYVSTYLSDACIPLTEVDRITESRWCNPPTVTIHLQPLSPYGDRIDFIPKTRWWPFGAHPIVAELQSLCFQMRSLIAFDFLVQEFGFTCAIASCTRVRYESIRVYIEVNRCRRDGEVSISFGRLNTEECFSFWLFLKLVNPTLAKSFGVGIANTTEEVAAIVNALAMALRSEGKAIIIGDDSSFERMKDVHWWDFCPEALAVGDRKGD